MTVLVTGARGMVGRSLCPRLPGCLAPSSSELDLRDAAAVDRWFDAHPVDAVVHLAARLGGLGAKLADPSGFFLDNVRVVLNVIEAADRHGVDRLILIGSACAYPMDTPQPMAEDRMLAGTLESGNEGYGLAKACGAKLCAWLDRQHGRRYLTLHPPNLIGPHDHFETARAQVVASLLARFHAARLEGRPFVEVWGTGQARREFLFVEDLVDAILHFLGVDPPEPPWVNVGSGVDVSIRELAATVREVTGYAGEVRFDATRPDGVMQRLLDSRRAAALGWTARTPLRHALERTYAWYCENEHQE